MATIKELINRQAVERYVVNALAVTDNEQSLFNKLQNFVELAIGDMSFVINQDFDFNDNAALEATATNIIVCDAFLMAISHLDLILTPNGFGVVSNNTIAPASPARVDALRTATMRHRDTAIDRFIAAAIADGVATQAIGSPDWWSYTLFPIPNTLCQMMRMDFSIDNYKLTREDVRFRENVLADRFLSREVLDLARSIALTKAENQTRHFLSLCRFAVTCDINAADANARYIVDELIRGHFDDTPFKQLWLNSKVAQLWQHDDNTPPTFNNRRGDKAYWL